MPRGWWAKLALLVTLFLTSIVYVIPTIANLDLEKTNFPVKKKVNLGLDLQGGLYMVLGVDFNKVFHEVLDRQVSGVREQFKSKGIAVQKTSDSTNASAEDPRIEITFEPSKRDDIHATLNDSACSVYGACRSVFFYLERCDDTCCIGCRN